VRYCVNPECPFQAKFRRPAEYQDAATTCSDCGMALGNVTAASPAAAAAPPSAAAAPWSADLWRRVLVSAAVVAAVVAASALELPGLFPRSGRLGPARPVLTFLSVGMSPFFWAMLLVEAAAAAVPGWRPLREDGVEGRRRLWRVALGIGLVLAVLQSATSVWSLQRSGVIASGSVTSGSVWSAPLLIAVMFGGSLFTVLAARVASQAGLGAGFALVALGEALGEGWQWVLRLESFGDEIPPAAWLFQVVVVVAVVGLFRFAERPARAAGGEAERPRRLPFPVAGVLPLMVASSLLFTVLAGLANVVSAGREAFEFLIKNDGVRAAVEAVVSVNVAIAVGVWCHRPSKVAAAWARWTAEKGAADLRRAQVAARVRALLPTALAWNVGLLAVWILPIVSPFEVTSRIFSGGMMVLGVAIALDLAEEARARAAGDLAHAWTLIRPYEVEPALEALRAAGLRAHARGAHGRATQQFWGVLLPIHVLVPPDQVEKARAVLMHRPS